MAPVVGERVRRFERARHGISRLPEHGVQERVAGDERAHGLHRSPIVAERCARAKRKIISTKTLPTSPKTQRCEFRALKTREKRACFFFKFLFLNIANESY